MKAPSPRAALLPDPQFAELSGVLNERMSRVAAMVTPDNLSSLLDPLMCRVLKDSFDQAGADEGTVWLLDAEREHLVPSYNTGPHAEQFVGQFKQPLNSGLICMVLASEQPFLENEVFNNAKQSKLLDDKLNVRTHALIAVPFYFLNGCRGVISCVQLIEDTSDRPSPAGFDAAHLETVQRAATLLSKLIEYRLLSASVGWGVQ